MSDICGDNRFELIEAAKAALLENTNIEDSQADMAALDSILYRCWQMGWLGRETCEMEPTFIEPVRIDGYYQEWRCLECDEFTLVESIDSNEKPKFCSNCGAKVVD